MVSVFKISTLFFNVVDMVLKSVNIIYFFIIVVLDHFFQVVQMDIIYLFFGPYIQLNLYKFDQVQSSGCVIKTY